MPVTIAIYKESNYIVEIINDRALRMLFKDKSLIGKPFFEEVPELESQLKSIFDQVVQSGIPFHASAYEITLLKNGEPEKAFFDLSLELIQEDGSTFPRIMLAATEVTEQVVAHKIIEDSENDLQDIFYQAPTAIAVLEGENHRYVLANLLYQKMINRKEEELLGKTVREVFPELEGSEVFKIFDDAFKTGEPFVIPEFETRIDRFKDGLLQTTYYNFTTQPLKKEGQVTSLMVVAYDITEQVESRRYLEESEKQYDMMVKQSPFGFAILEGEKMVITLANDSVKEMWGKGNHLEGKPLIEVLPEISDQPFPALLHEVYTTGVPFYAYEIMAKLLRNGKMEEVYFNVVYQPHRKADQTISGVTIIAAEITPQAILNQQIKASEERYHNLIISSPSAIGILQGEDLVITIANDAIIEIWGKGKEIIGKSYFEALPELAEQGYKEVFERVYKTGKPFTAIETPVKILQDGKTQLKYYNFILYAQRNFNNHIDGIGIIATEVTTQALTNKSIKESEAHFRQMADLMPTKISNADPNGDVTYFNKQWLEFSNYSFEELRDFGYHKMMHPDEVEEFGLRLQEAAATGKVLTMEMRFRDKEGNYKWHSNLAAPIKDEEGNVKMWLGVTTEIQQQKELREELEQAVRERTQELVEANEELVNMNKELQEFTFVASHDLQEPLRKIQTFAGRILEKENQNLSASGKDMFHRMQEASNRMQTLIHDLLAFSHLGTQERKFESTDLKIIIEIVKKELKEAIEEKDATIEVGKTCEVKIIPFQFKQLLHNLIGNALKFSKPGTLPHITIDSNVIEFSKANDANLPFHKAYCHIRITDNGIGFEKEYSEKIFEVFQRLHSKEAYVGTGIGLAIVKKIVANHNGIITATSEPGKWTRFDIYIPA